MMLGNSLGMDKPDFHGGKSLRNGVCRMVFRRPIDFYENKNENSKQITAKTLITLEQKRSQKNNIFRRRFEINFE